MMPRQTLIEINHLTGENTPINGPETNAFLKGGGASVGRLIY